MNALTAIAAGLPVPSQPLAEAVAIAARNASYAGPPMELQTPQHVRDEAQRRADILASQLRPAGAETAQRWLIHLAMLVAKPPVELEKTAEFMAGFLADLPARVFTRRSLESMAEANKFWPTYQEVKAHLSAIVAPVHAEIASLRAVGAAPEPTPPTERPSVEHIQAQFAALKAELAARRNESAVGSEARKVTPSCHSPDQLAALYRQQVKEGGRLAAAAATRLAVIERQLEGR